MVTTDLTRALSIVAAAPDLLAALIDSVVVLERECEGQQQDTEGWRILRAARAAIAKAEGNK
jgi:hypothetical protein